MLIDGHMDSKYYCIGNGEPSPVLIEKYLMLDTELEWKLRRSCKMNCKTEWHLKPS
jgi:hypothetical protein